MKLLLVDDEAIARGRIQRLLVNHSEFTVVGEAENAAQALSMIGAHEPDVVLLDIEMPGVTGLSLAELPGLPAIIFVTAHANFALSAFGVGAHDYLVKPVSAERLLSALERVQARLQKRLDTASGSVASAVATPTNEQTDGAEPWRITVTLGTTKRFLDARDVPWFWADDKYTCFAADGEQHTIRESLDALELRLAPYSFIRVHRGALVQRRAISAFDSKDGGTLVLTTGDQVPVSRRALAKVRAALGL